LGDQNFVEGEIDVGKAKYKRRTGKESRSDQRGTAEGTCSDIGAKETSADIGIREAGSNPGSRETNADIGTGGYDKSRQ